MSKLLSVVLFSFSLLLIDFTQGSAQQKATLQSEVGAKDKELQSILYFEGISYEKMSFKSPDLKGKNYQIIIKEFVKGELKNTDIAFNSKEDEYFRLKDGNLSFAILSKVSDDSNFKISFQFNGFSSSRKYKVDPSEKDKFTLKSFFIKEIEISIAPEAKNYILAYMTPYVRPDKSEAYCEVAQSGVDPERLYDKYKIPHYFLVEIKFS